METIVSNQKQARELAKVEPAKRLIALEQTIETGRKTFVEVGVALAEIRDSRLYRSDHATFEEYCRTKWGWSRVHVHRVIEAAATVKMLPIGNTTVSTESQARELAKVEPAKRLIALEQTIETGRKTFVEVGLALSEIRDARLYRSDFDTFEAYCKSKWNWERAHAYRLIDAAGVVKQIAMSPIGDKIKTESQARELAKVEPAKRVEVLEKAAESGPVTAKTASNYMQLASNMSDLTHLPVMNLHKAYIAIGIIKEESDTPAQRHS